MAAYQRELRAAQRSAEISAVEELNKRLERLQEVHLQEFTETLSPAARPAETGGEGFASKSEADAAWNSLLRNEPAAVIASIERAFEDNEVSAAAVGCEGDEVMLLMTLGEPEQLIPDRCPDETPAGRPTIRRRTKTEINEDYAYLLASNVLATVKEAFACAPSIDRARVVVITGASADADRFFTPIYCGAFTRDQFAKVNWKKIDPLEMIVEGDEALLAVYGRTNELVAIDLTDHEDLAETLETIASQLGLTLDPDSAPEKADEQEEVSASVTSPKSADGEQSVSQARPPVLETDAPSQAESIEPTAPDSDHVAPALRPLVDALSDEDSDVRYRAMQGLGNHLDKSLLPTIEPLLHDEDTYIRRLAVDYYPQLGASDTVARLVVALGDTDPDVRYRAMQGLGNHLDKSLLPTIEPLLHDEDNYIRRLAVDYYAQLIE